MTIDEAAAKIAEEVFRTIEHEKRILKSDIVEAAGKVLRSNGGKPLVAAEIPINDSLRQAQQWLNQRAQGQQVNSLADWANLLGNAKWQGCL